jgi:hypothetical protein
MRGYVTGISVYVLVLAGSSISKAEPPPYVSIAEMITKASAVGVVRIEKIEIADQDTQDGWLGNRIVTLRLVKIWRGELPDTFQSRVQVDRHVNASARLGAIALVFVGEQLPSNIKVPEGHRKLFEAGQGFKVIEDLVRPGDHKLGETAIVALKEAVDKYRPSGKPARSQWDPILNDEAATPLLNLINSENEELRRWSVGTALRYAHVTPLVARRFVEAIDHSDQAVSRAAARHLVLKRYEGAAEKLRQYALKLPKDDELAKEIARFVDERSKDES